MYPCPKCRNDRPDLHAACVHCSWDPDEPKPQDKPSPLEAASKPGTTNELRVSSVICMVIGCLMFIAALVLLILMSLFNGPIWVMIAAGSQMLVAVACIVFGFLFRKTTPNN